MKYLLTGGGTGGHVYPALAIANEIRQTRTDAEFLYVGHRDKLDAWVVPEQGYSIRFVRARPFPRTRSLVSLLRFASVLAVGVVQAAFILLRYRPQIIISTGGFVSAPILFAHGAMAKVGLSRARVFLYEPNAYPGLLNQITGRLAQRIGVAFEQAGRWFDAKRVAVVGYPVRRSFLNLDRQAAREKLGIDQGRKVVLAFGGSGGAKAINEAVLAALPRWQAAGLEVIHVTGRYKGPDYDAVADTEAALAAMGMEGECDWYRRLDYADEIVDLIAVADLVICRAGAGTLTEMAVSGTPTLIVPLPTSAEDHQALNAREMERIGAAQVLYQEAFWDNASIYSGLDGEKLAQQVLALCADDERLQAMSAAAKTMPKANSLELIAAELDNLTTGQHPPVLRLESSPAKSGLPAAPNVLLRWVQARVKEVGGVEAMEHGELAYLRYQADRLLASEGWCEIPLGRRNVGIKLVAVLNYQERLPLLLHILTDRTLTGWMRRFCGGDFRHGGIIRRNVVEYGLRGLGATDTQTRAALLNALEADPYFEVRAWSAQALGEMFTADDEIESALCAALDESAPEVVVQALSALGKISHNPDLLARLRRFYLHPNWQFREQVVLVLIEFLQRGVLEPAQLERDPDQVLISTPYFEPEFTLGANLRELAERVRAGLPLAASQR
ncbi:MAG: glycosyltransferase [Gemmatimonadetes bacterium]|nr:glycosyltransferase [Gemmatimonadota bacterium]